MLHYFRHTDKTEGQAPFQLPAPHKPIQFRSTSIGYNIPFVESTFPANRSSTVVA
jgi:hypothetical protein